eukprot:scaffold50091_cov18-Tisochrysis_lutea.AAC.1
MVDMVIHVKKNCFGQLTPPHSTQRGVVSVWDFQRPYLMNAEVSNIKLCQCKEDVMLSSANAHGPGAPVRAANFQPLLEHPITAGPPRDPISSPMLLEYFTGFGQIVEVGEDLGPSSSLGWKDQTPSPSHLMVSGNTRTATLMKDWVIEGTPSRDRPFVRSFLETQMFQVSAVICGSPSKLAHPFLAAKEQLMSWSTDDLVQ